MHNKLNAHIYTIAIEKSIHATLLFPYIIMQGPVRYDENGTIIYTRIRLAQLRKTSGMYRLYMANMQLVCMLANQQNLKV